MLQPKRLLTPAWSKGPYKRTASTKSALTVLSCELGQTTAHRSGSSAYSAANVQPVGVRLHGRRFPKQGQVLQEPRAQLAAALAAHVHVCHSRRQARARQDSVRARCTAASRHRGLAANSNAALCLRAGAEKVCTASASQPNVRPNVEMFFKNEDNPIKSMKLRGADVRSLRRNPEMAKTLFDKIWDSHVITDLGNGFVLLHIDRLLLHDLSGARALQEAVEKGYTPAQPRLVYGTPDHA